jgi:hypothetical protein
MGTRTITILSATTGLMTKTSTRVQKNHSEAGQWITAKPQMPKYFNHRQRTVSSVYDFADIVQGIDLREAIIRGDVHDDCRDEKILPRRLEFFGETNGGTKKEWVWLDIDGVPFPEFMDPAEDIEECVEWLITEHLPAEFHDVSCHYQLSGTHGLADPTVLKVHLFFMLDRPVSTKSLKVYCQANAPVVDASPLNSDNNACYIAPPIFENATDPFPRRTGVMDREFDHVTLPDIDVTELRVIAREQGLGSGLMLGVTGFEDLLNLIGSKDEGRAGWHEPIRNAVMAYIRKTSLQLVDDEALKERVREAIINAPRKAGKDDRDIERYLSDQYLDSSIKGARERKRKGFISDHTPVSSYAPVSLKDGERMCAEAVAAFLKDADIDLSEAGLDVIEGDLAEQIVHAIMAETGIGKTEIILTLLSERPKLFRFHYYIEQHRLADEIRERFRKISPRAPVRIHRGRSRDELADDGMPMCFEDMRQKADLYEKANISVREHLCVTCEHKGICGWSRQHEDKGPGLVIMPQQYAFEESAKRADAQIFDESFYQAGIRQTKISLASLMSNPDVPKQKGKGLNLGTDTDSQADLSHYRSMLMSAFIKSNPKVPTLQQLRDEGITAEVAREARMIEYKRANSITDLLSPDASTEEAKAVFSSFRHKDARQHAAVWKSIEEQIDLDREQLHGFRRWTEDVDGQEPVQQVMVRWSVMPKSNAPTLILDATLDERITRRFFPTLSEVTRIAVEPGEGVRIRQVTDHSLAKNFIAPDPERDAPAKATQKVNNAKKLGRIAEVMAAGKRKTGLITYKDTESAIADLLPANILTGHFNATRGLDQWSDAEAMIFAGRTQPGEDSMELLAEALFYNDAVEITRGEYGTVTRSYLVKGNPVGTEATAHPDPIVEAVRWQCCEGELIQNIGRPRPIRRGKDNPLEILIATDVPLPIRIDELTTWDEEVPSRHVAHNARGVVLSNAADIAKAYPDLYKNEQAVKDGKRDEISPDEEAEIEALRGQRIEIKYRLEGKRTTKAWIDLQQVRDPKAWLEERLGEVVFCDFIPEPEDIWADTEVIDEVRRRRHRKGIIDFVIDFPGLAAQPPDPRPEHPPPEIAVG